MKKRQSFKPVKNPNYPGEEQLTKEKEAELAYSSKREYTQEQIAALENHMQKNFPVAWEEYRQDNDPKLIPFYMPGEDLSDEFLLEHFGA